MMKLIIATVLALASSAAYAENSVGSGSAYSPKDAVKNAVHDACGYQSGNILSASVVFISNDEALGIMAGQFVAVVVVECGK